MLQLSCSISFQKILNSVVLGVENGFYGMGLTWVFLLFCKDFQTGIILY